MKASRKLAAGLSAAVLLVGSLGGATLAQDASASPAAAGPAAVATPGQDVKMLLLPKFLGILPFDQANTGAMEAATELQNPTAFTFTGPAAGDPPATQIDYITNAPTQGYKVVMLSNNAGDQTAAAAVAAQAAGTKVVTWDSPIPTGEGESVFVAQVDFNEIGGVMATMSRDILGADGGEVGILSAGPDSSNQNAWIAAYNTALADPSMANIKVVETVYGNDKTEDSYNQAVALINKWPNLKLIMSPTSVGIVAAAKALTDQGLCDSIKVSGLGLPADMKDYTLAGCAPEFALWSFIDLGYLTYYTSYMLATGAIQGVAGETFTAGRMGDYTITADPTRPDVTALRILMGPFTVYDKDNVEAASK